MDFIDGVPRIVLRMAFRDPDKQPVRTAEILLPSDVPDNLPSLRMAVPVVLDSDPLHGIPKIGLPHAADTKFNGHVEFRLGQSRPLQSQAKACFGRRVGPDAGQVQRQPCQDFFQDTTTPGSTSPARTR